MRRSFRVAHLGGIALVLLAMALAAACSGTPPSPAPVESPRTVPSSTPSGTPTAPTAPTVTPSPPPPTATPTATPLPDTTPVYGYRVINSYPHDREAFTQGLVSHDGVFYEGTGLYGRSSLRKVQVETSEVLQVRELPDDLFGEGVTILGDQVIQLTWQARKGFVYDKATFDLLGEFTYPTQGWGITHDGKRLIMSDGTTTLYFRDPGSFAEIGHIDVFDEGGPIANLNELEYIEGEIWANIWLTDRVARIDPQSGRMLGWIDLAGLLSAEDRAEPVDVLNGIAYDAGNGRIFVTGKLWPRIFEIELVSPR